MKKLNIWLAGFLSLSLLLSACGPQVKDPDCPSMEFFCIGLVTSLDGLNDQAFNQAAWEAMQQARSEWGANVQVIETANWKDYAKNITTFADEGYDAIVTVGYDLTEATTDVATKYPDQYFIGVDQSPEKPTPNYVGLIFPDDEAGFLAGALAAQLTQSGKIGGVFASDAVTYVWRFGEGFKAGAQYIKPEMEVLVSYHNDTSIATSFADPEWGASAALGLINQGADIICGAGGTTGNGAVVGAVQAGALAIGYNTDQFYTLPDAQKGLLSSAIKLIKPGVYALLKAVKDGAFPKNNQIGEVGYAPFHRAKDKVSDKIKAKMDEIRKGLLDGTIQTNVPAYKP